MNILKLTNGVPTKYSEGALKRDNPDTLFPNVLTDKVLADFNCYTYTIDPKPTYNKVLKLLQYVKTKFEQRYEGWWVQAWDVIDFEEDAAKSRLKSQRQGAGWS
jgi:hypothetical protein